jgi:hypothetical protein
MRYTIAAILLGFGLIAVAVAIAAALNLPYTINRMYQEPEDMYLNLFWLVIAASLGSFWLFAACHIALRRPRCIALPLRIGALVVLGIGTLLAVISPFAELDKELTFLLSLVCLTTGLAVLRLTRTLRLPTP